MANPLTKLKPKRRWLQFSLRTTLLVVTVSCVALTVWVVPAERQRRAVAAIEALGGRVFYVDDQETTDSFPKAFLRRWVPQDYFHEVQDVQLASTNVHFIDETQITDVVLAHLEPLRKLHRLHLDDAQITDVGLVHLQGLTNLEVLLLSRTQITDAGLAHLKGLKSLHVLSLDNTQVADAGLAHLRGLTSLETLWLNSTQVDDAGLAHLKGLTNLQELWLYGTQVTDAGVATLRKTLANCAIYGP